MLQHQAERADGQLETNLALYPHKNPESPRQEGILQRNFPSLRPLADRLHQSVQTLTTRVNSLIPSSADLRRLAAVGGTAVMLTAIALVPGAERAKAAAIPDILPTDVNSFEAGFHFSSKTPEELVDNFQTTFNVPTVVKDGKPEAEAIISAGPYGSLEVGIYQNRLECGLIVNGADGNYTVDGFGQRLVNNSTTEQFFFYPGFAKDGQKVQVKGTFTQDGRFLNCTLRNLKTGKTANMKLDATAIDRHFWSGILHLGSTESRVADLPTFASDNPVDFSQIKTDGNINLANWAVTPLELITLDGATWQIVNIKPEYTGGIVNLVQVPYSSLTGREKVASAVNHVLTSR